MTTRSSKGRRARKRGLDGLVERVRTPTRVARRCTVLWALGVAACSEDPLLGCYIDGGLPSDVTPPKTEAGASTDEDAATIRDGSSSSNAMAHDGVDLCGSTATEPPTCQLPGGLTLPEQLTVDPLGTARFYAGGAALPAGRYRVSYVGGCTSMDIAGRSWAVHGSPFDPSLRSVTTSGEGQCWLVTDGNALVSVTPGTAHLALLGSDAGPVANYDTLAECVAANCGLAPLEFDFSGGKLGVRFGNAAAYPFHTGEEAGGESPTFRVTRLDGCP